MKHNQTQGHAHTRHTFTVHTVYFSGRHVRETPKTGWTRKKQRRRPRNTSACITTAKPVWADTSYIRHTRNTLRRDRQTSSYHIILGYQEGRCETQIPWHTCGADWDRQSEADRQYLYLCTCLSLSGGSVAWSDFLTLNFYFHFNVITTWSRSVDFVFGTADSSTSLAYIDTHHWCHRINSVYRMKLILFGTMCT